MKKFSSLLLFNYEFVYIVIESIVIVSLLFRIWNLPCSLHGNFSQAQLFTSVYSSWLLEWLLLCTRLELLFLLRNGFIDGLWQNITEKRQWNKTSTESSFNFYEKLNFLYYTTSKYMVAPWINNLRINSDRFDCSEAVGVSIENDKKCWTSEKITI